MSEKVVVQRSLLPWTIQVLGLCAFAGVAQKCVEQCIEFYVVPLDEAPWTVPRTTALSHARPNIGCV